MPTLDETHDWRGHDLHGEDEKKIGEIVDIYLDQATGEPEWLAVKTGLLGSKVNFVPIAQAVRDGDHLDVPFTKDRVKDAPNAEADGELSPEEERRLYEHYDLAWGEFDQQADDSAMTRSEEELVVGTRREETGRARLRKYVVTEDVQTTTPVSREEVRVEREPVPEGDAGRAMDRPAIREEEQEVTLHAEEPVVDKRVVPKERVRLGKETHVDQETVSGEVRTEHVDVEAPRR